MPPSTRWAMRRPSGTHLITSPYPTLTCRATGCAVPAGLLQCNRRSTFFTAIPSRSMPAEQRALEIRQLRPAKLLNITAGEYSIRERVFRPDARATRAKPGISHRSVPAGLKTRSPGLKSGATQRSDLVLELQKRLPATCSAICWSASSGWLPERVIAISTARTLPLIICAECGRRHRLA
jgi:hypothetical protein